MDAGRWGGGPRQSNSDARGAAPTRRLAQMFTVAVQGDTHTLAALVSDYAARGGNDFASHLVPHPCKNEARIAVGAGSADEARAVVAQAFRRLLADLHALQQQVASAGAPLQRVRQHDAQVAALCLSEPLVARVWRGAPLAEPSVAMGGLGGGGRGTGD